MEDSGRPDPVLLDAEEIAVERLPNKTLVFTLGSRYCETDKLSDIAWQLFGSTPRVWRRVQAICDFVCNHLSFGYQYARATRTAYESYQGRVGVCRDFAHLAVAFCRCMNIPARYANGFLGDIGVPPDPAPMDYNAWFEVFLNGLSRETARNQLKIRPGLAITVQTGHRVWMYLGSAWPL